MRFLDLLKLSLRMFKARTMRTLLTILGMSVGIAAIMFLVSFGYGLQRTLLERITTSDALASVDVTIGKEGGPAILDNAAITELSQMENVTAVVPVLELAGQGRFDDITLDINTVSSESSLEKSEGLTIEEGRFFTEREQDRIVITQAVAQVFNIPINEMIGKSVTLTIFPESVADGRREMSYQAPVTYTIVGVAQGDSNSVYLPLSSLTGFPLTNYTKLKVKSDSSETLDALRRTLEEKGFIVSSISETVDQANKVFSAVQIVLMIFGMIALIVSAIGMFNTMTIALLERTEEIGIMKAIGASNFNISLMFIMESTLMGFLGALGGITLGFLEGEVINLLINLLATRFGGEAVDLFYSPLWFTLTIIAFGAFVGLLTGIFPARKASSLDTLEALRYK